MFLTPGKILTHRIVILKIDNFGVVGLVLSFHLNGPAKICQQLLALRRKCALYVQEKSHRRKKPCDSIRTLTPSHYQTRHLLTG